MPKEDGGFDLRSTASNSVIIIGVVRLVHDILKMMRWHLKLL